MNFLTSRWTAPVLAVVIGTGTTWSVLLTQKQAIVAKLPKPEPEAPPLLWSFKDAEIERFIAELREQRKKLDAREADIEKSAAQLAVEREELAKVRADVQRSRDELSQSIVELQESEAKNLKTLASTYSTLSANAAVNILTEMDDIMVVKILALMKPDKVGGIFQEMARPRNPESGMAKRAAQLSDKLRLLKEKKDLTNP